MRYQDKLKINIYKEKFEMEKVNEVIEILNKMDIKD